MPLSPEKLIDLHPVLFHVSLAASFEQVQKHGLRSTTALLDLFEYSGVERFAMESRKRPKRALLRHPLHGEVWLNDQRPLHEKVLERCCPEGVTPQGWIQELNRRVFFWPSLERLKRLHEAKAAKSYKRLVFEIKTEDLLKHFGAQVELSPINSGATFPLGPAQRHSFLPLNTFPFDRWCEKRKEEDIVVEVTVPYAMNKPELLALCTTV